MADFFTSPSNGRGHDDEFSVGSVLRDSAEWTRHSLCASEAILYLTSRDMLVCTGAPDAARADRWRWAVRYATGMLTEARDRLYPLTPDDGPTP